MADVTLLFGIGATKAGTSWLQFYLERHPEVHLWRHKELHYFDALDHGRVMETIDQLCRKRAGLRDRMQGADAAKAAALREDVAEIDRYLGLLGRGEESAGAYVAFLKKGRRGAKVVGDITPAYALLSEARLKMMAGLAPATRFIYILRDPIDRLWSNIRMMAGWKGGSDADVADRANWIFDRWARGEEQAVSERCDYAGALGRLTRAVPDAGRLITFYEELFSQETARRICAFLGVSDHPAPLERRVHAGPALPLDVARRALAADRLAPQYDYVEKMFGRVPARWQSTAVGA
ncbi:sulfotransferase family protein [Tropicimonas sp. S265A]|uniref:sulfotransferase family protein n=1 Tax=Tropicimonas sp. S265A TaxID=3415134 RepID=UPI003C7B7C8F